MIDWTMDNDGIIHGVRGQYDRSQRYVKCRRCMTLRPGNKLCVLQVGQGPICYDHTDRPKTVAVPQLRTVQMAVHLQQAKSFVNSIDAPVCKNCGDITVRSGSCYKCMNCGETTGCS